MICSLYRSHEPVSKTSSTYIDYVRAAAASGSERVYHYNAISEGTKGVEAHIALCSFAGLDDVLSEMENQQSGAESAAPLSEATTQTSQSDYISDLQLATKSEGVERVEPHIALYSSAESENVPTKTENQSGDPDIAPPLSQVEKDTIESPGISALLVATREVDAKSQSGASSLAMDQSRKILQSTGPRYMGNGNIPEGRAEDLISWTDDDTDAVDFKNYPDYDPDQDSCSYHSTTDSNTETTTSAAKKRSPAHDGYIQSYVKLKDVVSSEKNNSIVRDVSGKEDSFFPQDQLQTPSETSPTLITPQNSFKDLKFVVNFHDRAF